jgi:transcriptional regulator with XRE-family HTH domain
MACKLNISQQDYRYLENQAKNLTAEQIAILAKSLDVSEIFLDEFNADALLELQKNLKETTTLEKEEDRNDNKVVLLLNEKISLLEKNIFGLRNQIKEQNKTIREQNETIKDLRKLLVESSIQNNTLKERV